MDIWTFNKNEIYNTQHLGLDVFAMTDSVSEIGARL